MSTIPHFTEFVSVQEYLEVELNSEVKHEYVGGVVHAMAGVSEAHSAIALNLYGILYNQLRGKACRAHGSDMKLLLKGSEFPCFYYPDAMVVCDPSDSGHGWRERPSFLFEIISESTRQIDEREKRLEYSQLPSLQAYVRIEQTKLEVVIDKRGGNAWTRERIAGLEGAVELGEIRIPLADLYEQVSF